MLSTGASQHSCQGLKPPRAEESLGSSCLVSRSWLFSLIFIVYSLVCCLTSSLSFLHYFYCPSIFLSLPWCCLSTLLPQTSLSYLVPPPDYGLQFHQASQGSLKQRGLVLHFPGTKVRPALRTVVSAVTWYRWGYTYGSASICLEYHDVLGTRGCVFMLQWACPELSWLCGVCDLSRGNSPHLSHMKSQM